MQKLTKTLLCAALLFNLGHTLAADKKPPVNCRYQTEAVLDVAKVISAFPVGFCLLTEGQHQYAAYFDSDHNMTVASRMLDSDKWQFQILPSKIGWDGHNYVTMAVDDNGYLHLAGNMHCVPLIYFRSSKPHDITTFERVKSMTGENEGRCTYPQFMRGAGNSLIFHYRDGSSGKGNEIYNVYNHQFRHWKRLLDKPLTDGRGKMNAYMTGPTLGPDGWFHLGWVWRNTFECETNHDPSYARSRDLIHWETINGKPLPLPITIDSQGTLIDPVPEKGGIINGALKIGFDSSNTAIATYHKFDTNGNTQAYAARFKNGQWDIQQLTNWDYRWEFAGGGSINFDIRLSAIEQHGPGQLALPYSHSKYGSGLLIIDELTLQPIGKEKRPRVYPSEIGKVTSDFPKMQTRTCFDKGITEDPTTRYMLRWESLPRNRDRKPAGALPEPVMLKLYKLVLDTPPE
ncbi:MAG: BNR repeat-containing protein [Kiritimatiellae bacterium]|jgi:hypothetical protein|nr:BNR repeat-containing protein [Kiritimatiellia bacterium]